MADLHGSILDGGRSRFVLIRAPTRAGRAGAGPLRACEGDTFDLQSAGGGGYGDPKKRDRAAVARDIAEGYVSRVAAERDYGWSDNSMVRQVNQQVSARHQAAYAAKIYRSKYPGAPLRVFRSGDSRYSFVVDDPFYSRPEKIAEFNQSICPATALIELTTAPPHDGKELVVAELLRAGSEMSQIHSLAGLENALTLRHPELVALHSDFDRFNSGSK